MDVNGALAQLPLELSNGFHVRCALDIADSSANLGNHEVVAILLAEQLHVALNLVGNVRHHLNGLAQIVATALLVNHRLVYAACCQRVGFGGLDTGESLVVAEVEVGFHSVNRHIAFAMLVRVECSRVDVNVRVKFLDSDVVTSCLQELTD